MNDEAVHELARKAGIAVDWIDANDRPQRVSANSLRRILDALDYDGEQPSRPLITTTLGEATHLSELSERRAAELVLEDGARESITLDPDWGIPPIGVPGYHLLHYADREIALAVAPRRCLTLADLMPNRKAWGLAVQLYSLKRPGDGGIGDTTALAAVAKTIAHHGADVVAVSPTHSLFPHDLSRFAPYAPSSRLFLNPLLADPAAVLGEARVGAIQGTVEASFETALIDWPRAAATKYALLRRLFDDFALHEKNTPLAGRFDAFVRAGGARLDEHARFEAHQGEYTAPILYYAFLQWIASEAFACAQATTKSAGMLIGLVGDLAIGVDQAGSEVSARPGDFLRGLSVGAPPDAFNALGQDWGLTTFSPHTLVAGRFEPFIATLRANMRHRGGLRIDHAMGMMRLWLVPHGAAPSDGAYLTYPFDDLLHLLALESQRNGAIVIGEDLGTVPPGFRQRCHDAGIAGMDVLWFQRDRSGFLPPDIWRDDAVAMTTTHDLPTVAGWWRGADLDLRRDFGLVDAEEAEQRELDRVSLWRAFTTAGAAAGPPPQADQAESVVHAAVGFVSKTPAPLALVALEDVAGLVEQPNLPGTTHEHANWRRRFAMAAPDLLLQPAAQRRLDLLNSRKS